MEKKDLRMFPADEEVCKQFGYEHYVFASVGSEWAGDCYRKKDGKFDMICLPNAKPQRFRFSSVEEARKTFEALITASRI